MKVHKMEMLAFSSENDQLKIFTDEGYVCQMMSNCALAVDSNGDLLCTLPFSSGYEYTLIQETGDIIIVDEGGYLIGVWYFNYQEEAFSFCMSRNPWNIGKSVDKMFGIKTSGCLCVLRGITLSLYDLKKAQYIISYDLSWLPFVDLEQIHFSIYDNFLSFINKGRLFIYTFDGAEVYSETLVDLKKFHIYYDYCDRGFGLISPLKRNEEGNFFPDSECYIRILHGFSDCKNELLVFWVDLESCTLFFQSIMYVSGEVNEKKEYKVEKFNLDKDRYLSVYSINNKYLFLGDGSEGNLVLKRDTLCQKSLFLFFGENDFKFDTAVPSGNTYAELWSIDARNITLFRELEGEGGDEVYDLYFGIFTVISVYVYKHHVFFLGKDCICVFDMHRCRKFYFPFSGDLLGVVWIHSSQQIVIALKGRYSKTLFQIHSYIEKPSYHKRQKTYIVSDDDFDTEAGLFTNSVGSHFMFYTLDGDPIIVEADQMREVHLRGSLGDFDHNSALSVNDIEFPYEHSFEGGKVIINCSGLDILSYKVVYKKGDSCFSDVLYTS